MKKTIVKITVAALAAALVAILALNTHFTFGVVLDGSMNGRIFTRSPYNYISYEDTIADPGDLVLTVNFTNPLVGEDDILFRWDFVLTEEA